MPTRENTSGAPTDGAAAGGWRAFWKKYRTWMGTVLTSIVVIPLGTWGVVSAKDWFTHRYEEYLSAVVTAPSPARICQGGQGWVFAKDRQQLPGLPVPGGDMDAWAKANGGIPASGNYIEVTLHALNGHKVTVPRDRGISVEVKSRTDPPSGTYPSLSGGCGGILPYRFELNLDANPVAVTAKPDEGAFPGEPRLVDLPHEIGSDAEVWHLAAVTETCTCEWTATVHWIADNGKEGTTSLNAKDPFFQVAAVTRAAPLNPDWHGGWT